ncbi:MAG: YciC family protein [Candidatus Babeliales bacterium]|jgi:hypothetical protein
MNFSLVKAASKFAYSQLYQNTKSWFMLCLKTFLIVFAMTLGLTVVAGSAVILFGLLVITPNMLPVSSVWFAQIVFAIVLAALILLALVKIINFAFIPFANALDVAQGKPMRKFENKMTSSALLLVTMLMLVAIVFGLFLLIIPGIIFLVRFSLAPCIVIDERCGAIQAMSKSWNLTKNNFAVLFPVVAWTGILQSTPIINIFNYFFPFTYLAMSFAYVSLKEKQG